MDAIFTHHDSPFFKSAIPMTVDPLPYKEFSQFLREKFTKGVSFMKTAGFNNPSTVKRAIIRLIKLNILFESEDEYRFTNPFFRAWLPHKG